MTRTRAASVVITGVPALDRRFRYIAVKVARKACRSALGKGLTIIAKAQRQLTPVATTPGHNNSRIKRSIKGRQNRQRSTGIVTAKAGVGVGARGPQGFAHLIAMGTSIRKTSRGENRGRLKPNGWIGAAYRSAAGTAMAAMLAQAEKVIRQEAAQG